MHDTCLRYNVCIQINIPVSPSGGFINKIDCGIHSCFLSLFFSFTHFLFNINIKQINNNLKLVQENNVEMKCF